MRYIQIFFFVQIHCKIILDSLFPNVTLPQDVYFDDESAEVVISPLRPGEEQNRFVLFCA